MVKFLLKFVYMYVRSSRPTIVCVGGGGASRWSIEFDFEFEELQIRDYSRLWEISHAMIFCG